MYVHIFGEDLWQGVLRVDLLPDSSGNTCMSGVHVDPS